MYKLICENCNHVFETDDKFQPCPECGDTETSFYGESVKNLTEYENKLMAWEE